jgi:ornithine cyclodeaminase/alanine dehydrogenase-like protein (mu-crystallin family)
MRVLDRATVVRLLDVPSCIRAVEQAFRARGEGRPAPSVMCGLELADGTLHAKMAGLELSRPYVAAKMNANFPRNPLEHNLPTIQGVLVLFDATNGVPLAVMDSAPITTLRTAATSAVAASLLARPDASTVTFVGCGVQARAHLEAIGYVRPLKHVFAVDSHRAVAEEFSVFVHATCGADVTVASSIAAAARASAMIVTTTPSHSAVLDLDDVSPGTFVAAVGADNEHKQEIAPTLLGAAAVVVDDLEQCARFGDLHHALAAGVMRREQVRASLDQIVAGAKPGRLDDAEIVVFDSTGLAIEDVAAATLIYERAAATDLSTMLNT